MVDITVTVADIEAGQLFPSEGLYPSDTLFPSDGNVVINKTLTVTVRNAD